jgi:hypothetical protein
VYSCALLDAEEDLKVIKELNNVGHDDTITLEEATLALIHELSNGLAITDRNAAGQPLFIRCQQYTNYSQTYDILLYFGCGGLTTTNSWKSWKRTSIR